MLKSLGKTRIAGGKYERQVFTINPENGHLSIDYDSDFYLSLHLPWNKKNIDKSMKKAEKLVAPFLDKEITIQDLEKAGFNHDIPNHLSMYCKNK